MGKGVLRCGGVDGMSLGVEGGGDGEGGNKE